MRKLLAAFAILSLSGAAALAFETTEGEIKAVNVEKRTITLDDGESYKMPGEFDVASLTAGEHIVLAYDEVNGERLVTDMTVDE